MGRYLLSLQRQKSGQNDTRTILSLLALRASVPSRWRDLTAPLHRRTATPWVRSVTCQHRITPYMCLACQFLELIRRQRGSSSLAGDVTTASLKHLP